MKVFLALVLIFGVSLVASFGRITLEDRKNARVVESGSLITRSDDGLVHVSHPSKPSASSTFKPSARSNYPLSDVNPGLVTSLWYEGTAFSKFYSYWIVPPVPTTTADKQVFYFYNALENSVYSEILQPSLQWNVITGNWSVAAFYGTVSGGFYTSSTVVVHPGDVICGDAYLSGSTWTVAVFVNNGAYATTYLQISDSTISKTLDWAYFGLESYYINYCTDYPPSQYITFSQTLLQDGGVTHTPSWETYFESSLCPVSAITSPPALLWNGHA